MLGHQALEGDGAAWKTEWSVLPRACGAAAAALALATDLTAGLQVDERRMRENLEGRQGYVLAEPAMLALGAEIGPRRAHELIHAAAARGLDAGVSFHDALSSDPDIAAHLPEPSDALRPERALGSADELVRRVLGR